MVLEAHVRVGVPHLYSPRSRTFCLRKRKIRFCLFSFRVVLSIPSQPQIKRRTLLKDSGRKALSATDFSANNS